MAAGCKWPSFNFKKTFSQYQIWCIVIVWGCRGIVLPKIFWLPVWEDLPVHAARQTHSTYSGFVSVVELWKVSSKWGAWLNFNYSCKAQTPKRAALSLSVEKQWFSQWFYLTSSVCSQLTVWQRWGVGWLYEIMYSAVVNGFCVHVVQQFEYVNPISIILHKKKVKVPLFEMSISIYLFIYLFL